MGSSSLERLARRRRGGVRRPDLVPGRSLRGRRDCQIAGGGGGPLRRASETSVIVRRGDDFLMLHRAVEDYWHVVAGVVEDGETFAEAAARELREETGLDAPVAEVRMRQSYRVPEQMRNEYLGGVDEVAIENFTIAVPGGWAPVLNEEPRHYRWPGLADAILKAD